MTSSQRTLELADVALGGQVRAVAGICMRVEGGAGVGRSSVEQRETARNH